MQFCVKLHTQQDISRFVQITSRYAPDMELVHDRYIVNAKSILGVLSMDLSHTLYLLVSDYVDGLENELRDFLAA